MPIDDVRRAYAALGLRPGASSSDVRRRYKALARRWHPDRFAADVRNSAEASEQMGRINAAYQTLARHLGARGTPPPRPPSRTPGRRFTRQELDAMIEEIGTAGPIEWMLDSVGWVGRGFEAVLAAAGLVLMVARLVSLLAAGDLAAVARDPDVRLLVLIGILALLAAREARARRDLEAAAAPPADSSAGLLGERRS